MMEQPMRAAPFVLAAFVSLALLPAGAIAQKTVSPTKRDEPVACTMEAKLCPDGKTYVSRQGPHCEFASCPDETATPPATTTPADKLPAESAPPENDPDKDAPKEDEGDPDGDAPDTGGKQ